MSAPSTFGWYRPWLVELQESRTLSSSEKAIGAVLATSEWDGVVRAILKPAQPGDACDLRDSSNRTVRLSTVASLDPKTVRRALAALERDGWISRRRSKEFVHIELLTRTGTSPVLNPENGHQSRSETGTSPHRNGNHARSATGTTPVPYETPASSPTSPTDSPNPRKRGLSLPARPFGNRQRDIDAWEQQVAAIVEPLGDDLFPDIADRQAVHGHVRDALNRLKRAGVTDPTPDEVRDLAAQRLEPTERAA